MKRMTWSALAAGIVFAAGYIMTIAIPGGGEVTESDFTDFYDSSSRRAVGMVGVGLLIAAAVLVLWFLIELRGALGVRAGSVGAQLGHTLACLGIALVAAGACITAGPASVQWASDADFVGVPIAHAISQSGLWVELFAGMYLLAIATILLAIAARASGAMANWVAVAGIVAGVIMLGSFIWLPGVVFPLWLLIVGVTGLRKSPA